ncbi:G patch domain-containing protein 4 [Halyomorpha halys]|uniref:G patch domain-containing protein 4 n=1 Tax=Halyomorpha halys TaxID=286706 RepID=UPI0006D507D1|nr:G patch domain-containing protein 4 [Halyomorpha halys]
MDFGQKLLKKYGWSEGEGLGKNSDGIKEAIKPKRKTNNLGLGYKLGSEFKDNWWENVYDNAASNIIVKTDEDKGTCSVTKSENSKDTTQTEILKNKYKGFQKETEINSDEDSDCDKKGLLNDDEIFKKCGGRTVHKGARHGLTLSGKLSRIEKQEKRLLEEMMVNNFRKDTKKKKIK